MFKKVITYVDFDGNEHTEEFLFNLTKAEVAEMEFSVKEGMSEKLTQIVNAQNQKEIITIFKELLLKSYGVKSPDGKRFIKSEELSKEFSQTQAFSEFFMELATDENLAIAFVNGVIPQGSINKN